MSEVLDKKYLSPDVIAMALHAPQIAATRKAGQFVVIMTDERGERIPLTIVDSDARDGTITIIFQVVGKTTTCLADMKPGDRLYSLLGPLGRPTDIRNFGTAVCVGGGVGIGVVYPIAKALKEAGNEIISIIGARTRDILILEEEMNTVSDRLIICTDDGSCGVRGFVSQALRDLIEAGQSMDHVFAVGPVPMMRAVCDVTRPYAIETVVSLNPIMVDATGMCGACRVSVGNETRLACVDGPEFDGHQVDFDLLTQRLRMYYREEKESMEDFRCRCHE